MKQINLTQGKIALVSNRDWPLVRKFKWCAIKRGKRWYAGCSRRYGSSDNTHPYVLMHRLIKGKPGFDVDHQNCNGLDNRRRNLRTATKSQNMANQKVRRNNTSGIKGVHLCGKRWRAMIKVSGRTLHLGMFSTLEAAGKAYLTAAKHHFRSFARAV